jgi:hypothetical protein
MHIDTSKVTVTTTVTLASFARRTNSASGGPRYRLVTDDGRSYPTADDTADSFGWVPERLTGTPVKLTMASGYVTGIDPV